MNKISKYNYLLGDNNKFIYFNGMMGAVFAMNSKEHKKISSIWEDLTTFKLNCQSVKA